MRLGILTIESLSEDEQDLAETILDVVDNIVVDIKAHGGVVEGAGFTADEDDELVYTLVAKWIGTVCPVSADIEVGETNVVVWIDGQGVEHDSDLFAVSVLPGLVQHPLPTPAA